MKVSVFLTVLLLASLCQAGENLPSTEDFYGTYDKSVVLSIYDKTLQINDNCELVVLDISGGKDIINLGLPKLPQCGFVKFGSTNAVHIARRNSAYLFMVQSVSQQGEECRSKYTAVAITRIGEPTSTKGVKSGKVAITKKVKSNLSCGYSPENKAFDDFFYYIKHDNNIKEF